MKKIEIKELTPEQLQEVYPLVHQLRPHLTAAEFAKTATEMMAHGYRAVCLYDGESVGEKILAYAGFAEMLNLYWGRHIWVYELITDENFRGRGYGEILLSHIEAVARENNLKCVALCSGMEREAAHRFYENKMSYKKTSYIYRKDVTHD